MATVEETRRNLFAELPPPIRDALAAEDDDRLALALDALSEEDQEKVRDIIQALAALPIGGPLTGSDSAADLRDDPELDLRLADNLPSVPQTFFRIKDGEELRPPQDWLDAAHHAHADAPSGSVLYPVWYATTRKPVHDGRPERGFMGERDPSDTVHYGIARVFVPESHEPGSLGSNWLKRWLWAWQDDRLVVRRIEGRTETQFWAELRHQLRDLAAHRQDDASSPHNEVLLFVHGYCVNFNSAVLCAAQVGYDLAVPGITACFSWPSRGKYLSYMADEAAWESSVPALVSFIRNLAELSENGRPGRVHILAHSMGNRLVLRALQQLVWETGEGDPPRPGWPLGQVLLTAPDVDRDTFRLLAPYCQRATCRHTNLYVSRKDRAVYLSRWLHGFDRAGLTPPPMVISGIATVDVAHADLSSWGHSYFSQAREVLRDMYQVLHFDALPQDARRRLLHVGGGKYWQLG
jgi:esterase/lipase superfamily enzyme